MLLIHGTLHFHHVQKQAFSALLSLSLHVFLDLAIVTGSSCTQAYACIHGLSQIIFLLCKQWPRACLFSCTIFTWGRPQVFAWIAVRFGFWHFAGSLEAESIQSIARNIKKPQLWKLVDRPVLRPGGLACRATTRSVGDEQDPSRDSVPAAASTIPLYFPPWLDAFYRFTRPHTVIGTVSNARILADIGVPLCMYAQSASTHAIAHAHELVSDRTSLAAHN
jgi:hypothetical protein